MKAIDWQTFLSVQQKQNKVLYTISELANVAGTSRQSANVEIARLRDKGILQRYAQGIYGISNQGSPQALLELIDPCAYITGYNALFMAGMITQVPTAYTCFTTRRPHKSILRTAFGNMQFHTVRPPINAFPIDGNVASPVQALCDLFYLSARSKINPEALFTFRNVGKLVKRSELKRLAMNYPAAVRNAVLSFYDRQKV